LLFGFCSIAGDQASVAMEVWLPLPTSTEPFQFSFTTEMDGDAPLQPVTLNRRGSTKQKPVGWIPKDHWARIALLTSFAQFLIIGGLELYIAFEHYGFVESTQNVAGVTQTMRRNGEAIAAYHALFIAAQLFQLVLLTDAVSLDISIIFWSMSNFLVDAIIPDSVSDYNSI
jgi:hypothetical protein